MAVDPSAMVRPGRCGAASLRQAQRGPRNLWPSKRGTYSVLLRRGCHFLQIPTGRRSDLASTAVIFWFAVSGVGTVVVGASIPSITRASTALVAREVPTR